MFLSVVIPTYNRLPILQKCLQALEHQRLEAPISGYEVVLVDDGSTDDTVAWLAREGASLPHVRLIQQEHGGPAEGRNRGVEHAGERLRRMGVVLVRCPEAVGYHWHPALSLDQVPRLIEVERQRAKMGLVFYRKHPTRRVRFIIQFTPLHQLLWELLTLGGLLNERSLRPLLAWLIRRGKPGVAMELLRLPLNRIGVRALYAEARAAGLS